MKYKTGWKTDTVNRVLTAKQILVNYSYFGAIARNYRIFIQCVYSDFIRVSVVCVTKQRYRLVL